MYLCDSKKVDFFLKTRFQNLVSHTPAAGEHPSAPGQREVKQLITQLCWALRSLRVTELSLKFTKSSKEKPSVPQPS